MNHSNQVREFVITGNGLELVEVYQGPEGILVGSARKAQELQEVTGKELRTHAATRKDQAIERKKLVLEAKIASLKEEFESVQDELNKTFLEEKLKKEIQLQEIVVPSFRISEGTSNNLEAIRQAIDEHIKLQLDYVSLKGEETERVVWPFLLYFWGNKWTLGAGCEKRQAFRSFRVDLMKEAQLIDATFEPNDQRSLQAYVDYQRGADWRDGR